MSGPRAVQDLLDVWLRGLPVHESRAFNDLALALAFVKQKAESLPPSIDRRCAALINTKLDEAEHWSLAALRAAVDRSDRERQDAPCGFPNCIIQPGSFGGVTGGLCERFHVLEQDCPEEGQPMNAAAARSVDVVARLAEAWDLQGRHSFAIGGREHRALLSLAYLPAELQERRWEQLTEEQRRRLLVAARQAVEFGRACAWCFGEGEGARS